MQARPASTRLPTEAHTADDLASRGRRQAASMAAALVLIHVLVLAVATALLL